MPFKIIAGVIAAALFLAYVSPVLWRLKDDIALWVVAVLGIVMMLVDLWQSLQSKED